MAGLVLAGCEGKSQGQTVAPGQVGAADGQVEEAAARVDPIRAEVLDAFVKRIEEDVAELTKQPFRTRAEAMVAFDRLSPLSVHSRETMRQVLLEAGIGAEMDETELDLVAEEVLRHDSETLAMRIAAVFDRYQPELEYVDDLPPGDVDAETAVHDASEEPAVEERPAPRRGVPGVFGGWATVTSIAELQQELDVAAAQDAPVLINYDASWSLPAIHIRQHLLSKPEVEQALAGYHCVVVEMTEPTKATDALAEKLHSTRLPTLYVFSDAAALRDYLAGKADWPEPAEIALNADEAQALLGGIVRRVEGG